MRASAQPGIAVDRFAREIEGILKAAPGALAATECQPVGRRINHLAQNQSCIAVVYSREQLSIPDREER
jgi:hypothetical protein